MAQWIDWGSRHRRAGCDTQCYLFFLKTQWFSAGFLQCFSAFLYKVFALKILKNQRISAHFLHNSFRPGPVKIDTIPANPTKTCYRCHHCYTLGTLTGTTLTNPYLEMKHPLPLKQNEIYYLAKSSRLFRISCNHKLQVQKIFEFCSLSVWFRLRNVIYGF